MSKYDQSFLKAYEQLNEHQRQAVENTEGPVMVLAGPGTGKTQLLGVRVGYILRERDVNASNILCLTFTEAGAVAMRQRLLSFIGPEAYNAHIYTFHAFCNTVIQDNIQYFGGYRDLQLVSDIEQVEIIHQILDELPVDSYFKRLKGDLYYDRTRLLHLFSTMKRENWSAEQVAQHVDLYEQELRLSDDMKYKRNGKGYKKDDFKQAAFEKEMDKYWKTKEAAGLLTKYNKLLQEKQRFDYQDMILFVIDAFKNIENLKLDYQERYQYILIDEYQDTNGSQNDLAFLLADYWEEPNLFVVGDDDQAIFRFQGANMSSLLDYIDRYKPEQYVLRNNYRSYQGILNAAHNLIEQNTERIVNADDRNRDDYILQESRIDGKGVGADPIITKYQNPKSEQAAIVEKIQALHQQGVAYKDIAVLYRKHSSAADLVKYFSFNNIPLQIKKKINVLDLPLIRRIHNLIEYIQKEYEDQDSQEHALFEILHYHNFEISARDIGYIAAHCSNYTDIAEDDRKWRKVIADAEVLSQLTNNPDPILAFSKMLEQWIKDIPNFTIQVLFEKIITESGILEQILRSEEKAFELQALNKYFDLIKNEATKMPGFDLAAFIKVVDTMRDTNISLPLDKIIMDEDGVNFMTAHGSKGLEFLHVFIINATKKEWEQSKINRNLRFPPGLVPVSETSDIQDDRRLFYVALTRAKNYVHISFPILDDDGKDMETTRFVYELGEDLNVQEGKIEEDKVLDYVAGIMQYKDVPPPQIIDHSLVDSILQGFALSATALNKFIKCRYSFYFENILRIPMARRSTLGYGNAIHYALEHYFQQMEDTPDRAIPPVEDLIAYFKKAMKIYHSHFTRLQYQNLLTLGEQVLTEYYETYHHEWNIPSQLILEKNITNCQVGGVPIKGKIDKVEVYDQHVVVVDYKTGKYYKDKLVSNDDESAGGDYWRQLVFYKLLIDNDQHQNWKLDRAVMDFVEKNNRGKYDRIPMPFTPEDEAAVTVQLQESWQAIQNHEFEQFCEDEACRWCNFVRGIDPMEWDDVREVME